MIAICLLAFTEGSARYILPLIPPVLIVFFRQLELTETEEYRKPPRPFLSAGVVANGTLALTLAWALILSHADMEFARIYPRLARSFARLVDGLPAYYAGEWGFRYYMGQAGIRQLPRDDSAVRGGSFVALPRLALPYDPPAALKGMLAHVDTITCDVRTPFRLLDNSVPAGFYSTGWGLIPFSLSSSSSETMEVLQVNYLVAELPAAEVEGKARVQPWPGYVETGGRKQLSLLMYPGSVLKYPWIIDAPSVMHLACGVSPGSVGQAGDGSLEFEVSQRGAQGEPLASARVSIEPGTSEKDCSWQRLEIPMLGRGQGGRIFELKFISNSENDRAVGAFAEPFLQPR